MVPALRCRVAAVRGRVDQRRRAFSSNWRMGKTELRGLPSAPGFAVEFGTHPIAGADPEAPPLVGIHCSGSSLKQWTALAEALARHPQVASRVVGVNLFGSGATTA